MEHTLGVVVSHPMRPSYAVLHPRGLILLLGAVELLAGCATNPNVRVRRLDNGALQVDGPLAGPYLRLEELAASVCELMTNQPGASNGRYGSEYCALYYHSENGGGYFLSYLSDIKNTLDGDNKSCAIPTRLQAPIHQDALTLGGAHTHPHNRQFSPRDLSDRAHWNPTRFADKNSGQVFDRKLLMFFEEPTGECRSYSYNNFSRIVSALRQGEWIPIARVYNDRGDLKMIENMDWVP